MLNTFIRTGYLIFLGLIFMPLAQAEWEDISPNSQITIASPYFDRVNRAYVSKIETVYTGHASITGVLAYAISENSISFSQDPDDVLVDGESVFLINQGACQNISSNLKLPSVLVKFQVQRTKLTYSTNLIIKSSGCTVGEINYDDDEISVISSQNNPVVATRYFGPLEEKTGFPIYEIEPNTGISASYVNLKVKEPLNEDEFLLPITYNTEKDDFFVDGASLDDGATLVLPHLSLWSWIKVKILALYQQDIQVFPAFHRKGVYIGWGCQSDYGKYCGGDETTIDGEVLTYLEKKGYNIAYVNRGGIAQKKEDTGKKDLSGNIIYKYLEGIEVISPETSYSEEYPFRAELMFGISSHDLGYIMNNESNENGEKVNDNFSLDSNAAIYKDIFYSYVENWINLQANISVDEDINNVHLNIEFNESDNHDAAATLALIEIFKEMEWDVSVSIPWATWGSSTLQKMKDEGAEHFVFQLYNKGLTSLSETLVTVETVRRNFDSIGSNYLDVALPYYKPFIFPHHPSTENLKTISGWLSHYSHLNQLGGAAYWDLESFDFGNQVPIGSKKDPMNDASYIEHFDSLFITPNLAARYLLGGNANDSGINGNYNGIEQGIVYYSDLSGPAALFDGVNDYIALPDSLDTLKSNNAKSVFAWVKIPAGVSSAECSGWGYLRSVVDNSPAGHWRYLGIHIRDGVYKAASGIQAHQTYVEGDTLTPDTWHLIGFTWSPDSALKVYTDNNAPVSSPNTIPNWDTVAGSTFIGRQYSNPCGHYFEGAIKDVRFYDRQLKDSEVDALYNSGNTTP